MNLNDYSSDSGIKCGCGKSAVCAHMKPNGETVLSCEEHEYDGVTTRLTASCDGWRKISIDEFTIHMVMNS
ncbi:MAG: hypothetical protein WC708_00035 [Lentisphaeria bacterium]|jgi:hypothetical protein